MHQLLVLGRLELEVSGFNSLLEMHNCEAGVQRRAVAQVSILYWRCADISEWVERLAKDCSFNSLLEMRDLADRSLTVFSNGFNISIGDASQRSGAGASP